MHKPTSHFDLTNRSTGVPKSQEYLVKCLAHKTCDSVCNVEDSYDIRATFLQTIYCVREVL